MNPFPKSGGAWFASCLRSKAYIGKTKLTEMKHFMTALVCLFAMNMSAQFDPIPTPYNPDSDMDGMITTEDLMALLSLFSTEFESLPLTLNADSTVAIVATGAMNYWDCLTTCDTIQGNWTIFDYHNVGVFQEELQLLADDASIYMWFDKDLNKVGHAGRLYLQGLSPGYTSSISHLNHCVCQTEVMRQIEYSYVNVSAGIFQAEVNEKLSDGWIPLGGLSYNGQFNYNSQAFWRWAE